MSWDPVTRKYERYPVGTRLWIRLVLDGSEVKGTITSIIPAEEHALESYVIRLDIPCVAFSSYFRGPHRDPFVWRTDSSMVRPLSVLERLGEL